MPAMLRNPRRRLLLSAAAALLAAPSLCAQDQPPAPPAPGGGQGVKLAYKYRAGQVQRFRAGYTSDMSLTMDGPAAGAGPIPITVKMALRYSEKIAGVKDGVATVVTKMDGLSMNTNAMGTSFAVKMANGKTTMSMNGQPVKPGSPLAAALPKMTAARMSMTAQRDALGNEKRMQSGPEMDQYFGGGTNAATVQLPDHPVKVGDTWETTMKTKPAIPGSPGGGASAVPEMEIKLTNTLKGLETKNGKQFAIIETVGTGSLPAGAGGALQELNQNMAGTTRFDVGRGAVVSGQYSLDMGMKMQGLGGLGVPGGPGGGAPPPPGGGPGAGGEGAQQSPGIRIDGAIKINLFEAPAPAPGKAPAKKRPAGKKRQRGVARGA